MDSELKLKKNLKERNLGLVTNEKIPFSTASKKFMELLVD